MTKEELKEAFAPRLEHAMGLAEMNVQTLAKKCGIGEGTARKYLDVQNPNLPTVHTLYKMCEVLDVSADYFLFGGPYHG